LHLDTITVCYSPTNAQVTVLKSDIETLDQLRHVSVLSHNFMERNIRAC